MPHGSGGPIGPSRPIPSRPCPVPRTDAPSPIQARATPVLGYFNRMDDTTPIPEPQVEDPQAPAEPAPPISSRFLFVDVAALRAKQLRRGARVRLDEEVQLPHKAE